jgi:hypothetical protein
MERVTGIELAWPALSSKLTNKNLAFIYPFSPWPALSI